MFFAFRLISKLQGQFKVTTTILMSSDLTLYCSGIVLLQIIKGIKRYLNRHVGQNSLKKKKLQLKSVPKVKLQLQVKFYSC